VEKVVAGVRIELLESSVSFADYIRVRIGLFIKRWKLWLFICVCLGGFFCGKSYKDSLKYSSLIMSLNYEEAANGLTPNSVRFNIYEIKTKEVMEAAIAYAGLTGKVTASELSNCISVTATNLSNVSGATDFISTSYRITLTNNGCIKERDAQTMLNLVCKAYKDYFVNNYADDQSILSFSTQDLQSDEYLMTIEAVELRANQLSRYVSKRLKQDKSFKGASGNSFTSIKKSLDNFISYDWQNVYSYVVENGIAVNKEELINIIDYKKRMNQMTYDNYMAAYDMDNEGIAMYDEAMSSIVMIPTVDVSNKYYMSRTKTAMDYLATDADEQLDAATYVLATLDYDSYVAGKIKAGTSEQKVQDKAESMIEAMENYLDAISQELRMLDLEYIREKTHNYLTFSSNSVSTLSRFNISGSVEKVIECMICIAFIYLVIGQRERIVIGKGKSNEGI
jgi:hypothetical protein